MHSPTDPAAAHQARSYDVAASVRGAAFWAFVAAALLLYFSFGRGLEPREFTDDNWAWHVGDHLTIYTMRIGGILSLLAGLVLLAGLRVGLVLDGVFAILIGLGLAIGGVFIFKDGDRFNAGLYIVFGLVFINAGRNSLSEYRRLGAIAGAGPFGASSAGGLPLFGDAPKDTQGPD